VHLAHRLSEKAHFSSRDQLADRQVNTQRKEATAMKYQKPELKAAGSAVDAIRHQQTLKPHVSRTDGSPNAYFTVIAYEADE
jgi:hypothetical protein